MNPISESGSNKCEKMSGQFAWLLPRPISPAV